MALETTNGKWMSVDEVALFYGVARRTVYNWIEKGQFEIQRTPGGAIRCHVLTKAWEEPQRETA